ncbi:AAA family ATPase, partial [Klebsiella oxytoca]|uniref:AAA family ATPase n=1 Tax=Klebsiella oxytoca TaxID=571 RepID=UPI001954F6D7
SLAALVAPALGPIPGARIINSDRLRKTHFGVGPEARLGPEAYRPDISDTIYSALREAAAAAIRQGHSVVVDAVHARESERRAIED